MLEMFLVIWKIFCRYFSGIIGGILCNLSMVFFWLVEFSIDLFVCLPLLLIIIVLLHCESLLLWALECMQLYTSWRIVSIWIICRILGSMDISFRVLYLCCIRVISVSYWPIYVIIFQKLLGSLCCTYTHICAS